MMVQYLMYKMSCVDSMNVMVYNMKMRTAIIVTGLQRNAIHFIENQLNCLINVNDCDVFIYTADDNIVRKMVGNDIKVIKIASDDGFLTDEELKSRYGTKVKGVKIDYGNEEMNEFMTSMFPDDCITTHVEHNEGDGTNINVLECNKNIISQFFKVRQGMRMVEEYEKRNNFRYDYVLRMRMDSFFTVKISFDILVKTFDMRRTVVMPKLDFNYKMNNCDSFVFIKREYANILKDFVVMYGSKRHYNKVVVPEEELYLFIEGHGLSVSLGNRLGYRPGSYTGLARHIPYFKMGSLNELNLRLNFYAKPVKW